MHKKLPVLVLKDMILFPGSEIRLELTSEELDLINLCSNEYDSNIMVVMPSNSLEEFIDEEELPSFGIASLIKMKINMPNGKTRVVIAGRDRAYIKSYDKKDIIIASIEKLHKENLSLNEELAYVRRLVERVDEYVSEVPYVSNTIINQMAGVSSLDELTDIIALYLPISHLRKLEYLKEEKASIRAKMILDDINNDLKILKLEQDIDAEVSQKIDESQVEFILKEKLKVIKDRLGESQGKETDIDKLKDKIKKLKAPKKIKDKLLTEIERYEELSVLSPESGMIRAYIEMLLDLPYQNATVDEKDLNKVKQALDETHFGLDDAKERIIEYLAVKENTESSRSPILCFVGPPGVGKTTLAKSIASALNRNFAKISVGGVNDEADIIGHRRTYIGSRPGLIINGMKKAGSINPVFIIDEIDKMTKDIKGDPASALLEVLDTELNQAFVDHYIEEEYDLSKVMFITTANYIEQVPNELRDRLEIINISSYTEYEKLEIAKTHLIPEQLKEHGLKSDDFKIDNKALMIIIRNYTKEAGVRELTRQIARIMRKFVKEKLLGEGKDKIKITEKDLKKYLGNVKYLYNGSLTKAEVGIINGLSYTPFGGDILQIEVTYYKGTGNLLLTGSLGDVLKESAKLAFSYIKSHAKDLDIKEDVLNKNDFHLHVPEGAVSKDGPSAGITIATALLSALLNKEVKSSIAMTGELSLRGKVLPVGGVKEKLIAAHRSGIKQILMPVENAKDLEEVPENIKDDLEIILVSDYKEVISELFG